MAGILRRPKPKLADISCTRYQFTPGDCILVRIYRKIDKDEDRRIRKAIEKWAGCELRILIIDALEMDLTIEQNTVKDLRTKK